MENEWDVVRNDRWPAENPGMGLLRIVLLFGSAAIALARDHCADRRKPNSLLPRAERQPGRSR